MPVVDDGEGYEYDDVETHARWWPLLTNGESQYVGCFADDGACNLDYGPTASARTGHMPDRL